MDFELIKEPTRHYNEQLLSIDEKICELLNQRKNSAEKKLSFPPDKVISSLAGQFGFQKEYVESFFTTIEMEDSFTPVVVPIEFKKYVPMLKSCEKEGVMYTVTFIRQYTNSSVLYLDIDWEETNTDFESNGGPDFFELFIDDTYICRSETGGGTEGHMSYNYVISPALPDCLTGIEFVFKELGWPFKKESTGFEFAIKLD